VSEEAAAGTEAEGTGETVGEAKWAALRELERRFPGLDKASVRFQVLSEGERGLLGVGFAPARVVATLTRVPPEPVATVEPGTPAAQLRELLERVCSALGAPCSIAVSEDEQTLFATLSGPDLGLVIGKRGQTIDAVQYLANAIVWRGREEERKEVVVDAAGYRERRRASLESLAERAAADALQSGGPVSLEPMTAVERKIVHLHLAEREGVVTSSEGAEPNRYVVVSPGPG
jgi:spoIIIJ-associated protein